MDEENDIKTILSKNFAIENLQKYKVSISKQDIQEVLKVHVCSCSLTMPAQNFLCILQKFKLLIHVDRFSFFFAKHSKSIEKMTPQWKNRTH